MPQYLPIQYRIRKCVAPLPGQIPRRLYHDGYSCAVSGIVAEGEDEDDAGNQFPVYDAQRRGNVISAWIESEANEGFEIVIWNSDETEKTPTLCETSVDGVSIERPIIGDGNLFNIVTVRGIVDPGKGTLRRLFFKPIKTTGNKRAVNTKGRVAVSKLGLIQIKLYRVKIKGVLNEPHSGLDDHPLEEDIRHLERDAVVHESEKLLNPGHHTVLGDEEPCKSSEEILDAVPLEQRPFIVFRFRYAPRGILESMKGVVPSPPTEHPRRYNYNHFREFRLENLPDLNEELSPTPVPRARRQQGPNPTPLRRSTRRHSTAADNLQRDSESPVPPVKPEVDGTESDLQKSQSQERRPSNQKRREHDEEAESQPARPSPRKRVKVEQGTSSQTTAHDVKQEVKREASTDYGLAPQAPLDATDPRIERTVKVDAEDYVAALEAQNRELQARLPESERVRIVKNEPLEPMRHFMRGEVVDLADA